MSPADRETIAAMLDAYVHVLKAHFGAEERRYFHYIPEVENAADLLRNPEPGWFLPDSALNDLQQASVQRLWEHAKRARWTNAVTRKDSVETIYEADWIKEMKRVGDA